MPHHRMLRRLLSWGGMLLAIVWIVLASNHGVSSRPSSSSFTLWSPAVSVGLRSAWGDHLRSRSSSSPTRIKLPREGSTSSSLTSSLSLSIFDDSWKVSSSDTTAAAETKAPIAQSTVLLSDQQRPIQFTQTALRRPDPCETTDKAPLSKPVRNIQEIQEAAATTFLPATRSLLFWENMICGAISRSVAQTVMHPANTMKTILQNSRGANPPTIYQLLQVNNWKMLSRGAGANFILSVPHGAINFAVLELVRSKLESVFEHNNHNTQKWGLGLDFMSSCISTITCSVVSTPQMMICDNIMAGNYPNIVSAIKGLYRTNHNLQGFYTGWWPGLVGKIPSYALTWTLFQQAKNVRDKLSGRAATDFENTIMGCLASATTVSLMIPIDTIKTRLVTQAGRAVAGETAYKGIIDCAIRVFKEEGLATFYRGLPPRLVSVVPMIGIQFGVYEFMKKTMLKRTIKYPPKIIYDSESALEEAMMEVAASPEQPYPAPHFLKRILKNKKRRGKR